MSNLTLEQIKEKIERVTLLLGINHKELATKLGVTAKTISNWKTGKRNIPDVAIMAIDNLIKKHSSPSFQQNMELLMELNKYSPKTILTYVYLNKESFQDEPLYKILTQEAVDRYLLTIPQSEIDKIAKDELKND